MGNHFKSIWWHVIEAIFMLTLCADCFIQTITAVYRGEDKGHKDELIDDYDDLWFDYIDSREFQYVVIGLVPWRFIFNIIFAEQRKHCLIPYELENFGNEEFCVPVDDILRLLTFIKLGRGQCSFPFDTSLRGACIAYRLVFSQST